MNHKGPIGALERWCEKSHKRWSKVIKLLGIYTTIYSPNLLDAQERKFLDGVLAVDIEVPDDIRKLVALTHGALLYALKILTTITKFYSW